MSESRRGFLAALACLPGWLFASRKVPTPNPIEWRKSPFTYQLGDIVRVNNRYPHEPFVGEIVGRLEFKQSDKVQEAPGYWIRQLYPKPKERPNYWIRQLELKLEDDWGAIHEDVAESEGIEPVRLLLRVSCSQCGAEQAVRPSRTCCDDIQPESIKVTIGPYPTTKERVT